MQIFKKKCTYCGNEIKKGEGVLADVKTPEFTELKARSFCKEEHYEKYMREVTGTKRTNFCPSCGV